MMHAHLMHCPAALASTFPLASAQCLPGTKAQAPAAAHGRRLAQAGTIGPIPGVSVPPPMPNSVPVPGQTVPPRHAPGSAYSQCGGAGRSCPLYDKAQCTDSAYILCQPGNTCVRRSQWYWQVWLPA